MGRARYSWHEAYTLALSESDSGRLPGRIQYGILAIERRYAEWGSNPGTPAELSAIQKAIVALEGKLLGCYREDFATAKSTSDFRKSGAATGLRGIRDLFPAPRS